MNPNIPQPFEDATIKGKSNLVGSASLLHKLVAKCMFALLPFNRLHAGTLHISYAGVNKHFKGRHSGCQADLQVLKPFRFLWLLLTEGDLGIAAAYAEKTIETPSVYHLLLLGKQNETLLKQNLQAKSWIQRRYIEQHRQRHNSIENSKQNIAAHYDLGNDFYELWLDESMTYSSALFDKGQADQNLLQAQQRKYQRLLDELQSQPGEHILEIGCGWGGFAEYAASQNRHVTGITLSREQLDYAQARINQTGLSDLVELHLKDYRHQQGRFDHIVSIEMFEAVGQEYWQTYFEQLQRLLKQGGRASLQIITIDEAYAESYQKSVDFIQTYIFPGGLLPSQTQIKTLAETHGFKVENTLAFGQDYAKTLHLWLQAFEAQSKKLATMCYDDKFQRLWRYYLDYCRVGFETEHINVIQFTLHKT